jgi:hypothetical protein
MRDIGPRCGIERQYQTSVPDHTGKARAIGGNNGNAERHRLRHRRPETLVFAGKDQRIGAGDQRITIDGTDVPGEPNSVGDAT